MPRTFYGVLGVGPDADAEAIRTGYRERVTDVHPDVNDDPDAETEFKRLTIAKETLLNETERARYDRLGHGPYLRREATSSVWTESVEFSQQKSPDRDSGTVTEASQNSSSPASGTQESARTKTSRRHRSDANTEIGGRTNGRDTRGSRRTGTEAETTANARRHRRMRDRDETANRNERGSKTEYRQTRGTAAKADNSTRQQSVSGPYASSTFWESHRVGERTDPGPPRTDPVLRRLFRGLHALGPWVLVHLVFLTVAVGTCWYVYTVVLSDAGTSLPLLLALVGEVVLAVALSSIHVLSRLYR